jgi:hypothetical protein
VHMVVEEEGALPANSRFAVFQIDKDIAPILCTDDVSSTSEHSGLCIKDEDHRRFRFRDSVVME